MDDLSVDQQEHWNADLHEAESPPSHVHAGVGDKVVDLLVYISDKLIPPEFDDLEPDDISRNG